MEEQLELPLEDEQADAPQNLPVYIATNVLAAKATFYGLDVLALVLAGYDADDSERIIGKIVFVMGYEDAVEVARRIKSVAATVKPLSKQTGGTP